MDNNMSDDDVSALSVSEIDLRGTAFVIPLDAPLPNEIADVHLPVGSLYARLINLDHLPEQEEFGFIPVSGPELLALERVWKTLAGVKKVAVLTELPGARYDVIFDQARRMIGLRVVDWPSVAEAIATRVRQLQRTKDSKPWLLSGKEPSPTTEPDAGQGEGKHTPQVRTARGTSLREGGDRLPIPLTNEEE